MRVFADDALFPGYKEQIRFAALSLDGKGLSSYGECTLILRDHMIAHRASVLEGNLSCGCHANKSSSTTH